MSKFKIKNNLKSSKRGSTPIKGSRRPLNFYLSGIALVAAFIIPAAYIQTFLILDTSVVTEGKIQWGVFAIPFFVIMIAGLMLGRIRLLNDLLAQNNQQQQRELLNNTSSVVYIKDLDGRFTFINRRFEELLQTSEQEILGKSDYDLLPKEKADVFRDNDRMVITKGRPLEFDETVMLDDGEHTYISVKFPLKNATGEIYATCGISTDFTERMNMEEALRRSQKMDAIGQLTGGIAHDFNNQLGVIIGYLEFLKDYATNDKKSLKWIESASRATQRCIDLTQQLLTFSRGKTKQISVVNINEAIKDIGNMLSHSVTPEVEIEYLLASELWPVKTDIGEFQDMILNLVINARDAMPNGGNLIIETSNVSLDKDFSSAHNDNIEGDFVQIKLSDNGIGMDKETQEHVYEPFYTTKPEGEGTGLGLSMVYGFIKRYDGRIELDSEVGIGTSFNLYLPRSESSNHEDDAIAQDPVDLTGDETILIVDDEVALVQLANEYLSDLGYSVYTAENANQALEIISEENHIDLLFSDVVMPGGMNGYELAEKSINKRPELKVLLTSGFASKTVTENGLDRFSADLINKPYHKDELAQRIRQVLDNEPK